LENCIHFNKDEGKNLLLKMDVEGAEWESLYTCDEEVLRSFDMICLEMHEMQRLYDGEVKCIQNLNRVSPLERHEAQIRYEVMKKLSDNFYMFHAHANNGFPIQDVGEYKVSPIAEVSFVRKDLVEATPVDWVYTCHDATNNHNLPEIMLNFWPFVRN